MKKKWKTGFVYVFICCSIWFFLGGAVTFTLGPCCSLLGRIPDKNDHCAFTRGTCSRGEVMIFFEKNKVLGVEPNRVLNILEGI
jgi:hypothetical protein